MARVDLNLGDLADFPKPTYNAEHYVRLRARLLVDSSHLTEGLQDQPMLVQEIAEQSALVINARDVADGNFKFAKAAAASVLREVLKSEAAIEKSLDENQSVVNARAALHEAALNAALWGALMEGARTLTSSLKHRSELIVSGYLTPNAVVDRPAKPNPHYKGKTKNA